MSRPVCDVHPVGRVRTRKSVAERLRSVVDYSLWEKYTLAVQSWPACAASQDVPSASGEIVTPDMPVRCIYLRRDVCS